MNSIVYVIIQFLFNIIFAGFVIWGGYHLIKTLIKKSVKEALIEHERYLRNKTQEDAALQRVQEIRRKYA